MAKRKRKREKRGWWTFDRALILGLPLLILPALWIWVIPKDAFTSQEELDRRERERIRGDFSNLSDRTRKAQAKLDGGDGG